jgi:Xaa-Pro aminopeptidase
VIEKNMCLAYHSIHCVKGYEGVAIENTYRVTDTGCELLTKWPFDYLMVVGL